MKSLILLPLLALPLAAQYCSTATPACSEKLPLASDGRHSLLYRNYPLTQPNPKIERAMILIHGQGRNAHDYFHTGMAAAFLAGALDNTLVISPRFAGNNGSACKDPLAEGEISWPCSTWRLGMPALNQKDLTSYDFIDAILTRLNDEKNFPNLKGIILSGHSAGGQFTHRYAAANKVHNTLRVPVRYVVSNPSSYVYPDRLRLPRDFHCDTSGKCDEPFAPYAEGRNCTTYNDWGHGLDKLEGYASTVGADQMRANLLSRPIIYLMGELDTLPIAGFDSSCPSLAQGPTRFDRAKAHFARMRQLKAKDISFIPVPLCGHNNRCIWTADQALPILFPRF
ncbi:MAG: hypothetical protein ACK5ZU_00050 [Acidobacteriota bacterium]